MEAEVIVPEALAEDVLVVDATFIFERRLTPFCLVVGPTLISSTLLGEALSLLGAFFLGRGFLGALLVPMETTGFVGMITTVPPPGEVVAMVEDWILDSGLGVLTARDGRTITGLLGGDSSACVDPSLIFFSPLPLESSSSLAIKSAREVTFSPVEVEAEDLIALLAVSTVLSPVLFIPKNKLHINND